MYTGQIISPRSMRTNLLLLAGRGKRFSDAGHKTPKPLIEVDGKPMVIASARHLPPAEKLIFVVSGNLANNTDLYKLLKTEFPSCEIITQKSPLLGQAHSALEAKSAIDPESELTIASCDAGPIYSVNEWEKAFHDPKTDSLVWSFRHYPPQDTYPSAYSWIDVDENNFVKKVQYKTPISDRPFFDHAVVGWFSYKKAKNCFGNITKMLEKNIKTGLEFSLDECTNVLIQNNLKVKIFEIAVFKSWGTPNELKTYKYWQKYFLNKH